MSGGVDSSVAAALLKKQGYQVIGVMLRLWSEPGKEDSNRCCTPDAIAQARRVASILDIPFYVIDAKDIFQNSVVQYFLDGYAQGITPNPCLVCNRSIRWTFLLDHALALGAEYMATGHYVRKMTIDGEYRLLKAIDRSKDQSYILHVLDQQKLAHALFPVGDHEKTEIRVMATTLGLPVASRKDSQDLCFLAGDDYRAFIRRNAAGLAKSGPIQSSDGRVLGQHTGLPDYTIGQRSGLGFAARVPMYVLQKDIEKNALIVGERAELGSQVLNAREANWISGAPPQNEFSGQIKIRYTAREVEGHVALTEPDKFQVRFNSPQRDITPGQAAVIYQEETLLGGGIIY